MILGARGLIVLAALGSSLAPAAARDRLLPFELGRDLQRDLWRADPPADPGYTPPLPVDPPLPGAVAGTVRASDREGRGPVGRIRDLFPALRACWTPPAGAAGHETTIRVAFRRDGRVLGPPRITYAGPGAPGREGERLRASIHAALDACSPLAFTPSFGQAIAGRPVAIRFVDDRGR